MFFSVKKKMKMKKTDGWHKILVYLKKKLL